MLTKGVSVMTELQGRIQKNGGRVVSFWTTSKRNKKRIWRFRRNYNSPITTVDEKEVTPNDLKQMQKEMLRLKEENEILKKAMAIFA